MAGGYGGGYGGGGYGGYYAGGCGPMQVVLGLLRSLRLLNRGLDRNGGNPSENELTERAPGALMTKPVPPPAAIAGIVGLTVASNAFAASAADAALPSAADIQRIQERQSVLLDGPASGRHEGRPETQ